MPSPEDLIVSIAPEKGTKCPKSNDQRSARSPPSRTRSSCRTRERRIAKEEMRPESLMEKRRRRSQEPADAKDCRMQSRHHRPLCRIKEPRVALSRFRIPLTPTKPQAKSLLMPPPEIKIGTGLWFRLGFQQSLDVTSCLKPLSDQSQRMPLLKPWSPGRPFTRRRWARSPDTRQPRLPCRATRNDSSGLQHQDAPLPVR